MSIWYIDARIKHAIGYTFSLATGCLPRTERSRVKEEPHVDIRPSFPHCTYEQDLVYRHSFSLCIWVQHFHWTLGGLSAGHIKVSGSSHQKKTRKKEKRETKKLSASSFFIISHTYTHTQKEENMRRYSSELTNSVCVCIYIHIYILI